MVDSKQLERIESKLDKIIKFFNVDQESRRSNQELDRIADEMAEDMLKGTKLKIVNNN